MYYKLSFLNWKNREIEIVLFLYDDVKNIRACRKKQHTYSVFVFILKKISYQQIELGNVYDCFL